MPILKPYRGTKLNMSHSLTKGLVACLSMSEGTGSIIFDSSENHNICELQINPQWKPGRYGDSIEFNGSSDLGSINANTPLDFLTFSFSVVWMMKFPITQSYAYAGIIVDKNWNTGAGNTNCWGIVQNYTSTNSLKYYDVKDVGSFANSIVIDSNIPDGWHHFAFVRDAVNKRFKFYRDSKLVYDSSYINQTNLISHGLYIAQVQSRYTGGIFEDIKIYKCMLSAEDITWLYREPFCMFDRGVRTTALFVPFINLAGNSTAQSATQANLKRIRKITGSCSAVASAMATLRIIGEILLAGSIGGSSVTSCKLTLSYRGPWLKSPLEIERQWLTDALFNGMTSNAIKLGTALSGGWFWTRPTGCTALYRGSNMEQIDFDNILAVAEQDAELLTLPDYVLQKNESTWFYVVRKFNNCGWQEHTLQAAVKVAIDADGGLVESSPNGIFAWRAEQAAGNKVQLIWFYSPLEQMSKPVHFKIYYDGGTGQIDYENPIAEIAYRGQKFYSLRSEALPIGRYLFAIRAEDASGVQNNSLAQLAIDIEDVSPDEIEILKVETL
jgi:hypothetical protein